MSEKDVLKRMATIPGIVEFWVERSNDAKDEAIAAVLSGDQTKAIQCASLSKSFTHLAEEVLEQIQETKSR